MPIFKNCPWWLKILLWISGIGLCVLYGVLFGCTYKKLLGIPCPGCGMTRAWLCLLKGDIVNAFRWHPLFAVFPPVLALFVHKTVFGLKGSLKLWTTLLIIACVLMLGLYIPRVLGVFDEFLYAV